MFLPQNILFDYWIEHVTFGLPYIMFKFSTRIFYMWVPGFEIDFPCGIWCHVLTIYLLYVGPFLEI